VIHYMSIFNRRLVKSLDSLVVLTKRLHYIWWSLLFPRPRIIAALKGVDKHLFKVDRNSLCTNNTQLTLTKISFAIPLAVWSTFYHPSWKRVVNTPSEGLLPGKPIISKLVFGIDYQLLTPQTRRLWKDHLSLGGTSTMRETT
jgi:hypothetical protein